MKSAIPALALALFASLAGASPASAADKVRVVNEGGIRDEWTLAPGAKLAAPGYPAAFANRGENVCMAIGYRINPDGTQHWTIMEVKLYEGSIVTFPAYEKTEAVARSLRMAQSVARPITIGVEPSS